MTTFPGTYMEKRGPPKHIHRKKAKRKRTLEDKEEEKVQKLLRDVITGLGTMDAKMTLVQQRLHSLEDKLEAKQGNEETTEMIFLAMSMYIFPFKSY